MIDEKIWRALLAAGEVRKSWLQPVRTWLQVAIPGSSSAKAGARNWHWSGSQSHVHHLLQLAMSVTVDVPTPDILG